MVQDLSALLFAIPFISFFSHLGNPILLNAAEQNNDDHIVTI